VRHAALVIDKRRAGGLVSDPIDSVRTTEQVIGAAIEVHRTLGPGLLESVYEACLVWELGARGLPVERQVAVPVQYKGVALDCGYRVDLVVDGRVVIEVKSIRAFDPIHTAQLLTYLRLLGFRTGLLLNFGAPLLRDGVKRVVI
jgi:GxxExxY protein